MVGPICKENHLKKEILTTIESNLKSDPPPIGHEKCGYKTLKISKEKTPNAIASLFSCDYLKSRQVKLRFASGTNFR